MDARTYVVRGKRLTKVDTLSVGANVDEAVNAVRELAKPDEFICFEARVADPYEVEAHVDDVGIPEDPRVQQLAQLVHRILHVADLEFMDEPKEELRRILGR